MRASVSYWLGTMNTVVDPWESPYHSKPIVTQSLKQPADFSPAAALLGARR